LKYVEDTTLTARKAEIEIKLKSVRKMLDEEGLSGVLLMRHNNFSWITAGGRNILTLYSEQGVAPVLITKDKQYVLCSIIEEPRMREEEIVEELGFKLLYHPWYDNQILKMVEDLCDEQHKVGCDIHFAGLKMINDKIDPLHYSLQDNEIARYLHLGEQLSAGLEEFIVTVRPGMTEFEITGGLANALWRRGIDQVLFMVSADERAYKHRHGIPMDNVVLKNHLNISVNGRYKGLITTVTRMVHFGPKDDKLIKQYEDTCEIECRSIAAIKPGVDDIEGYRACKKAYEDLGHGNMWPLHGQGGAQSYNNRDYIITETNHRVTVKNQGYCFNPVIDGTKTEDGFIATEDGPLFITKPISFPVVEREVDGIHFSRPGLVFIT